MSEQDIQNLRNIALEGIKKGMTREEAIQSLKETGIQKYDWLGHGMYFWENNYARALQWAEDKKADPSSPAPASLKKVISRSVSAIPIVSKDSSFPNEVVFSELMTVVN